MAKNKEIPNEEHQCKKARLSLMTQVRLTTNFFDVPCVLLARRLLGQDLVRKLDDGTILRGRIIETECYLGGEDKASHSFGGRKSERNKAMFMGAGTAYVYLIYGMYKCFNISSQGDGAAVLIRSLQPLDGVDVMKKLRAVKYSSPKKVPIKPENQKPSKPLKDQQLCNGPSKLCQALSIGKECNTENLDTYPFLWLESGESISEDNIIITHRIGIDSCGQEWAKKPLRYYVANNPFVSVRDKVAEAKIAAKK